MAERGVTTLQAAATTTASGAAFNLHGMAGLAYQINSSFGATIQFEASLDTSTWFGLPMAAVNTPSGAAATSATGPGLYRASTAGIPWSRARISSYSSGSITVLAYAVEAVSTQPNVLATDSTGLSGTFQLTTQAYSSSVTVTRPNDTAPYTAGDVLGSSTGATAALTFSTIGPSGGGDVLITSASLERDVAAVLSGETGYNLYLYNVTPPSALGDNAAFDIPAGDRASFLGKISLGTPVDEGSTLYVEQNGINKQVTLASSTMFGYLTTIGAYTSAAQAVHRVTLHTTRL